VIELSLSLNDLLIPAFQTFLQQNSNAQLYDYYAGPFGDIEQRILEREQVDFDIVPTLELVEKAGGRVAIEIGSGNGRLLPHLAPFFETIYAVETSAESVLKSQDVITILHDSKRKMANISLINGNFVTDDISFSETPDTVILGSLSINLFLEEDVDKLLEKCANILPNFGTFIFGCFQTESVNDFSKYNGKIGSGTFIELFSLDEDTKEKFERPVFTLARFIPERQLFLQNWFIDLLGNQRYPRYAIAAQIEKIWSIETLRPYLESWGFNEKECRYFEINGGGADGQYASMYYFQLEK